MNEYIAVPTTAEITISADDDVLTIKQYWSALSNETDDVYVNIPRALLIPFLETLFARLHPYELNQIRNTCETWLDIAREKSREARAADKE